MVLPRCTALAVARHNLTQTVEHRLAPGPVRAGQHERDDREGGVCDVHHALSAFATDFMCLHAERFFGATFWNFQLGHVQ